MEYNVEYWICGSGLVVAATALLFPLRKGWLIKNNTLRTIGMWGVVWGNIIFFLSHHPWGELVAAATLLGIIEGTLIPSLGIKKAMIKLKALPHHQRWMVALAAALVVTYGIGIVVVKPSPTFALPLFVGITAAIAAVTVEVWTHYPSRHDET